MEISIEMFIWIDGTQRFIDSSDFDITSLTLVLIANTNAAALFW